MRITLGILLLAAALLLAMFEVIALLDPAGTALSNDAYPFGPPPPWHVHALWIAAIAAMGWGAVRLLRRRDAPPRHGLR
ncbi:MAG TPA: hypothetical protein VK420_07540 [Longimicrobium sp.]|nr:hypothetical protein [Longimicrobium sp.]